jgi:hypothetical protein
MHQGFQSSLIQEINVRRRFLLLKEEREALCGAVEKLVPFVVFQSRMLGAGRGAECRSAAAKHYDLRQVCYTVRSLSEGRNS